MHRSIDTLIINPPRHRSLILIVARLSSRSSRYIAGQRLRLARLTGNVEQDTRDWATPSLEMLRPLAAIARLDTLTTLLSACFTPTFR